jgi:hypothetical protein
MTRAVSESSVGHMFVCACPVFHSHTLVLPSPLPLGISCPSGFRPVSNTPPIEVSKGECGTSRARLRLFYIRRSEWSSAEVQARALASITRCDWGKMQDPYLLRD